MLDCQYFANQLAHLMVGLSPERKAEALAYLREQIAAVEQMTPEQRFADAARREKMADEAWTASLTPEYRAALASV
jgi:hypothetical protein